MNALVIHAQHNTGEKNDATGAFIPEARAFATEHEVDKIYPLDNKLSMPLRRAQVEGYIRAHGARTGSLPRLALFMHGLKDKVQTGHTIAHCPELARVIREAGGTKDIVVMLFACDAARDADRDADDDLEEEGPGGEGGFADALRDALVREGMSECIVYAHANPGHCVRNPYVKVFRGVDAARGGGDWLVSPRNTSVWRKWRNILRNVVVRNGKSYVYTTPFARAFPVRGLEATRMAVGA